MNICRCCNRDFEPKNRSDQKYCSPKCQRQLYLNRISTQNSSGIKDGLQCAVCGQVFKSISNTHLSKHNMTTQEYIVQYGRFRSAATEQRQKVAGALVDRQVAITKTKATRTHNTIASYGELTERQLQICYGGLLGDFGIHAYSKNRFAGNYLECYHCEEQVPYLQWIQAELKNFDCKFHEWTRFWKEYGREYTRYWITTCCHPTFTELRKFIYKDGGLGKHKVVTREWLDKLEPLGLAVWFMDDGTLQTQTKHVSLCTQSYSHKEHLTIQQYFKERWDLNVTIPKSALSRETGEQMYYTYFGGDNSLKFVDLIRDQLLDMFHYKIKGVA